MNTETKATVMKFGGTSVGDMKAFERVCRIVGEQIEMNPVVVTSAMTKVTDALLNAFDLARKNEPENAFESLAAHFARHLEVAEYFLNDERQTSFETEIEKSKREIAEILERVSRRSLPVQLLKDVVLAYGELLSSRLLTEVLRSQNINARFADARRLIVTDDEHGAANPIWEDTRRIVSLELNAIIKNGEVPVLGGFIAASRGGETTTFGTRRFGLFGGTRRRGITGAGNSNLDGRDRRFDVRSAHLPRSPNLKNSVV